MKYLHFTIDCDFIPNSNIVFDNLLKFVDQNKLKPTFFLAGKFAEKYPKLSEKLAHKYEIGCHGLAHGLCPIETFDSSVSYSEKQTYLKEATLLIEKNTGIRPIIFRAPYLKISEDTLTILKKLGYRIDSSIPSRRYDFGRGSINKLEYFKCPISPNYLPNGIFEIPPSALFFPINMRFIKIFGVRALIFFIKSCLVNRQTIVFYLHPAELVDDRSLLEYPQEKDYFYKGGGLHLLKELQLLIDFLIKKNFISKTMMHHLEVEKTTGNILYK